MAFRHKTNAGPLSPELKRVAFRILQESLANACRHSKDKRLFVELQLINDVLRIKVRDWGTEFDEDGVPRGDPASGAIHVRVKLLNGVATIQSEPGKGMSVIAELPLTKAKKTERQAARGIRRNSQPWSDESPR